MSAARWVPVKVAATLLLLLLGALIGSGVTLLVRGGDSTTRRTAPEIVKALLATECEDVSSTTDPAKLIAPVRASDGDWYTGCVSLFGNSTFSTCFRVKPDTLEVSQLPGGMEGKACVTLSGWPKP